MASEFVSWQTSGVAKVPALTSASFWRRLGAGGFDFGLNLLATTSVGWLASESKPMALLLMPLLWLATLAYEPVLHATHGATLGKYLLRIKVVDTRGNSIGWTSALLRSGVAIGISATWIYCTGSALFALPSEAFRGQGWGDLFQTLKLDFPPSYDHFAPYLGLWFWLEFASMLLSPTRRALHDYMAGTVVVLRAPALREAHRSSKGSDA